ncbi:MAG: HD domain-containing protein [Victivallales bacterium]|nr:HD domain-containing protein [Victivallales bacterium]
MESQKKALKKKDTTAVVRHIAELLTSAGGRALLVGGCVRDSLLGLTSKDFDMEVYGLSMEAIRDILGKEYKLDFVGMAFGVLKVLHYDIDIALPRVENKTNSGHKGFDVMFVPNLSYADAASRRDFTINAIMRDPLSNELIDPWNGVKDLHDGVLRHVSAHFVEDPLRVLRAMQFAARFDFQIAEETVHLCSTLSQDELAQERVAAEWEKLLLKGRKPSKGLSFLRDCGWIDYYPELKALIGCKQEPEWHPEGDVWEHTLRVLDAAAAMRHYAETENLVLMLAALCHDFGKPLTTKVDDRGRIISHAHDEAGVEPTKAFIRRIWNKKELDDVMPLVKRHMLPTMFIQNDAPDRAYRRLSLEVRSMELLADVAECDLRGVEMPEDLLKAKIARIDLFRERANALNVMAESPKPIILGRHLLERGFKPGPQMKPILDKCFDAQLNGDFNDLPKALEYLDSLLKESQN